jgi:glyceraldehyde-3-phosphate dehydrogenase/erythrose-4-phosphate dehydrogenase
MDRKSKLTTIKVVSWYDNEWDYSNKCLEMVRVVAKEAAR